MNTNIIYTPDLKSGVVLVLHAWSCLICGDRVHTEPPDTIIGDESTKRIEEAYEAHCREWDWIERISKG